MNVKVALGLLLALFLAACGGGIAPPNLPADYTLSTGDRVALGLPPTWVAVRPTVEDFRAVADHLRLGNPALADHVEEMGRAIEADTLRWAAYHPDAITSANVTAQRISPLESLQRHADANRVGLGKAGYQILEESSVTLGGRRYARTEAVINLQNADGSPRRMMLLQYTTLVGDTAYSISFGTSSYRYPVFEHEFDQIAATFHTP